MKSACSIIIGLAISLLCCTEAACGAAKRNTVPANADYRLSMATICVHGTGAASTWLFHTEIIRKNGKSTLLDWKVPIRENENLFTGEALDHTGVEKHYEFASTELDGETSNVIYNILMRREYLSLKIKCKPKFNDICALSISSEVGEKIKKKFSTLSGSGECYERILSKNTALQELQDTTHALTEKLEITKGKDAALVASLCAVYEEYRSEDHPWQKEIKQALFQLGISAEESCGGIVSSTQPPSKPTAIAPHDG